MTGVLSARPPFVGGDPNMNPRKVVVQHRSDMLLEEQIRNVRTVQEALEKALADVEVARTKDEVKFQRNLATELEQRLEAMGLILKIVQKINTELVYARLDLQKALKEGSNVNISLARKRIGWLEDRVDNLVGKRRQRSYMQNGFKASNNDSPQRILSGKDQDSNSDASFNTTQHTHELKLLNREEFRDDHPEETDFLESSINSDLSSAQMGKAKNMFHRHLDSLEDDSPPSKGQSRAISRLSVSDPDPDGVDHLGQRPGILLHESQVSQKSRGSRVILATPCKDLNPNQPTANQEEEEGEEEREYWASERNRFEYDQFVEILLQLDPLSYHQMGLAVPRTFVQQIERPVELPWRPKRKGSDLTDIHKTALDNLSADMNKMFDKVRHASLLSVNQTDLGDLKRPPLATEFSKISFMTKQQDTMSRETPVQTSEDKPSLSNYGLKRPDSNATITFPPVDKDRLGSSFSNRLVYYPKPLPYPENLPVPRTDRSAVLPRMSKEFSRSVPGETEAAQRFVDQRNLYKETKFTSSLFRPKVSKIAEPNSKEQEFRKMLEEEVVQPKEAEPPEKKKKTMKGAFLLAKSIIKLQGGVKWKDVKPRTGALSHSGLKWERVKAIVHHNLISQNAEERVDAARHLGALQCGDTMVVYALRERLRHDDHERVIYEATKSLIIIGCWDEEILSQIVHYLIEGNRDLKDDLLKSLIAGKNVQYLDKRLSSFKELSRLLSLLCRCDDPCDPISFHAAVVLGKMCVSDDNAKIKLCGVLEVSEDSHQRAETLEIMVRQMNVHDPSVIQAVLTQLQSSPVWKHREAAARQLIHLGSKWVLGNGEAEKVYDILEKRLWDDPNKNVRHEVAKVLAALGLYARACEKVEKKLGDEHEDVRVQAVISVGTLGMKNERVLRVLLEMLELDPSAFLRLMVIRTFGALETTDKRAIRALKVRVGGEERMSTEASRVLKQIGAQSTPRSKAGSRPGSKGHARGMLSKVNTQLTV